MRSLKGMLLMIAVVLHTGCRGKVRDDLSYDYEVKQTWTLDDLPHEEIVQFESVFWEPQDTTELRRLIISENLADGRSVLEIGTGTGLLSLLCLRHGASEVVATDINPAAVACARYNAANLNVDENLSVRQVSREDSAAYAVIEANERFDLILSNPPWEGGTVSQPADHAFYDPDFELLDSILAGLPKHLKPAGRCYLSYGNKQAIRRVQRQAAKHDMVVKVLDDRDLETLSEDFLPGMLLEIRLKSPKVELPGHKTTTPPTASEDLPTDNLPSEDGLSGES